MHEATLVQGLLNMAIKAVEDHNKATLMALHVASEETDHD